MKKSLLMKTISILLVLTLMTSTITFCLGGCSVKITPNRADIDIPTYSDTRLEVSSQNVSNNYAALTNALKSNDTEEIKEKADALKDAVNQSLSEFKLYSEEIRSMIGDSDDIIKKRAEEFEKYFNKNSQKALDAINGIILGSKNTNSQSYQQSIDTLEKYFEVEKEIMVTSDNLENSISKKTDAEKLSVNNLNNYVKNSVSAVGSSRFNESSLKLEDETSLTDEMKALADQLKTPLQVYLYLKNHINYEAYSGSRKGAVATFDSNGGNDVDQASLLIAMLRYLNYPAKYVNGTIFISADQALKLTSAKDLNTAGTILVSSGKKVLSIVSGGLNGGSSDGLVSLAYMVDIGFSIVDIVEAFQMIPTMLGLFSMGGPFGIIVGTLVAAVIVTMVVFAVMDYVNSIQLMCRYVNGDEEAGKELEKNAVINVSVAAGGAIVGKVAKAGLAKVAKKKIVTQLGEELAEKLMKNSDSCQYLRIFGLFCFPIFALLGIKKQPKLLFCF